jgi:hypothetical protein
MNNYKIALQIEPRTVILEPRLDMKGYLWRRNKGPIKTFSRKFFWIKQPECLLMATPRLNVNESIVVADILACKIYELEYEDRPFIFEISFLDTVLTLQAEDEDQYTLWLLSLELCRKRANSVATEPGQEVFLGSRKVSRSNTGPLISSKRKAVYDTDLCDLRIDDIYLSNDNSYESLTSPIFHDDPYGIVQFRGLLSVREVKTSQLNTTLTKR